MSDQPPFQQDTDEAAIEAFLALLSKNLDWADLFRKLPADVTSFAKSRDLSLVDVNEVITGSVDI